MSMEGSIVNIDVPSIRLILTIRLWVCITSMTRPERSILTASSHETQVTFRVDRQWYEYQRSRSVERDDESTVIAANTVIKTIKRARGDLLTTSHQPHKSVLSDMTTLPVYENSTTFFSIDESDALPLADTPMYG